MSSRLFRASVAALLVLCTHRVALGDPGKISNADALRLSEKHYGDPCTRKVHDYLFQEVGKRCVPALSFAELELLKRVYTAAPSDERPFLRFARVNREMTFLGREVDAPELFVLDARPSTYPSGSIGGELIAAPRVLELKNGTLKSTNEMFVPDSNTVIATPTA